jgi:hypothetical protein
MLWKDGAQSRPLMLKRLCRCGCDSRGLPMTTAGYVTGSLQSGTGVTLPVSTEDEYRVLRALFDRNGLHAEP